MVTTTFFKWQRYTGVVGVAVLWAGISAALVRTQLGLVDPRPLSYLGVDPASAGLFSGSLLISAVLFVNFGFYVRRTYGVHNRFLAYLVIGQAGQIIAAIAPYGDNSPYTLIHTVAAFILAFSLPLLIREFTRSQASKPNYHLFVWVLWLELLTFVVGIGLFVFTKGIAPLAEALPAIGYHIWIITVTLVTFKFKPEQS